MITVCCAKLTQDTDVALSSLLQVFGEKNAKHFEEISKRKNAPESLFAYMMLAKMLGNAGCDPSTLTLNRSDMGKPYFEASVCKFSISHSEGYAVCALSDEGEIGVDIEAKPITAEKAQNLAKRYFTENEIDRVMHDADEFRKIWTEKEAKSKFFGISLAKILENEKKGTFVSGIVCHHFEYVNIPISLCTQENFGTIHLIKF
jgi:4'-phosphopantetheinyl transferase